MDPDASWGSAPKWRRGQFVGSSMSFDGIAFRQPRDSGMVCLEGHRAGIDALFRDGDLFGPPEARPAAQCLGFTASCSVSGRNTKS